MKKQAYKIQKMDWLVTVRVGRKTGYHYLPNLKEVKALMKEVKGTRQLFKISYEFRDVMG